MTLEEHKEDPVKGFVSGMNTSFALRKNYKERMARTLEKDGEDILRDRALQDCIMLACALIASKKYLNMGGDLRRFGCTDAEHIEKVIVELYDHPADQLNIFNETMVKSVRIVEDNWDNILKLADYLFEEEEMGRRRVRKVMPELFGKPPE
jgi:hypothetical protein